MSTCINLTGVKFGELTVLYMDTIQTNIGKYKRPRWVCQCSCGVVKSICGSDLRSGNTNSCGCKHYTKVTKHNLCQSVEYKTWRSIKTRCLNPNFDQYDDYGGRGITVCDEWIDSFETFLKDMGSRPSNKHSIDRIDNDKNYCKENCRWVTRKEQCRNKRTNRINSIEIANEIRNKYKTNKYTQEQLAEEYGCPNYTIQYIVNNKSWI